jgi:hypothetical protein
MLPFARWIVLSLLITLVTTVEVCAQSSFLDELRINAQSDLIDSPAIHPELPLNDSVVPDESPWDPDFSNTPTDSVTLDTGYESDCTPNSGCCYAPLIRYRTTSFQGAQAAYGIIPASDSNGLGIKTLDLFGTFAIPIGNLDHVISFTPFFRMDQLNAHASLGVPDTLYEAGVKSFWKKAINDHLTTMVLFTPSVRSDFESTQEAFKLFGMALLQWHISRDRLSMTGGAIYTGRQDFPVLPTMGIYWTPSPLWKFDVQFPSPRISRRFLKDGDCSETWAYLSGVFGGNTWAVKQASGQDDQLTLRDLRLVLGIEHLLRENRGVFVETGLVFNRSLEYLNSPGQIDFGDAILLRAGIQF